MLVNILAAGEWKDFRSGDNKKKPINGFYISIHEEER